MTYKQCIALMAIELFKKGASPALAVRQAREIWDEVEHQFLFNSDEEK